MTSKPAPGHTRRHHLGYMVIVQPGQRQVSHTAASTHAAHQVQCRGRLLAPARRHAQQRLAPDVVAGMLNEPKGVRVCPVQILQHNHQRAGTGQLSQQAQEGLASHRRRRITVRLAAQMRHDGPQRQRPGARSIIFVDVTITQRLKQCLG